MDLFTLTELLNKISEINEATIVLIILTIAVIRYSYKKLVSKTKIQKHSSLFLQDSEKQIKYKGSTVVATLIILLSYFKKKDS